MGDFCWGPGDVIESGFHDQPVSTNGYILDFIQKLESKIDTEFNKLNEKISLMDSRIKVIEQNQPASSPSSSSNSSSETSAGKRQRRSPPELQVRVCILYIYKSVFC